MRRSNFQAAAAGVVADRRVVVGLSGGVDSVALLHALVRGGADVRAAHIDHGLRDDSEQDAAFCAGVAANLGIPFAMSRIVVAPGNSVQGRARAQRYAALSRLTSELGGDLLAVAHHADDAWESVQLQTQRGAGAVGAAGPRLWSSWWGLEVVRPFLALRRRQVEEYACSSGLRWREDPSNRDQKYARARLRVNPRDLDVEHLHALRDHADDLAEQTASQPISSSSPVRIGYDRATIGSLGDERRGRLLLDAARRLHGELPGAVVTQLGDAIVDSNRAPRWFCGRRVAVLVGVRGVELHATRGHGTQLLDGRSTPTVDLSETASVPWFEHRIVTGRAAPNTEHVGVRTLDGVTLRGPRAGERIDTRRGPQRIVEVLAEIGVAQDARWRWPCIFADDQCLAVAEGPAALDHPILLPRGDKSGIFVGWERFVPRDFAVLPPRSRR